MSSLENISFGKSFWIIAIVTFMIYGRSVFNDFAYDDSIVITQNKITQKGISGIGDIFSSYNWEGYTGHKSNNHMIWYRPISMLSFALDYQFWGLNPFMSHLVNLILYLILLSLILYFIYHQVPQDKKHLACCIVFLFAVHPLHTEAVANIKSRDEILALVFSIIALILLNAYLNTQKVKHLFLSLALLILGLLSKESVVAFIAIFPVFVFYKNKKASFVHNLRASSAYFILIFLYFAYRSISFGGALFNQIDPSFNPIAGSSSLVEKYMSILYFMGYQIKLLFIPYPLICDYSYAHIQLTSSLHIYSLFALIFYACLCLILNRQFKKRSFLFFAIVSFLISIFPLSNLLVTTPIAIAERSLFTPSLTFCMMIVLITDKVIPRIYERKSLLLYAIAPIIIAFTTISFVRVGDWQNSLTLFRTDVQKSPLNYRLNYLAGNVVLGEAALQKDNQGLLIEAISYFDQCIAIQPDYYLAKMYKANTLRSLGEFKKAEHIYQNIENSSFSNDARLYYNYAGNYMLQDEIHQAIEYYQKALSVDATHIRSYVNLGVCYAKIGELKKAQSIFEAGILIAPNDQSIIQNLIRIYDQEGELEKKEKLLQLVN